MTKLLDLSDVHLLYGDDSRIVDLTSESARSLTQITLTGRGSVISLDLVGSGDTETVPVTVGETLSAQALWGDAMRAMSAVDGDDGYVALIMTESSTGIILPARLRDPVDTGLPLSAAAQGLVQSQVSWMQRAEHGYIRAVKAVTSNTSVTNPANVDNWWAVLTTAGSVGGTNLKVGIHKLSTSSPWAISGARGWIVGTDDGGLD